MSTRIYLPGTLIPILIGPRSPVTATTEAKEVSKLQTSGKANERVSGRTPQIKHSHSQKRVDFSPQDNVLQTSRFVQNMLDRSIVEHKVTAPEAELKVVGESSTALWTEIDPSERVLQLGKVQNLRTALRKLNGISVPANQIFSFWAQIGPPIRARGYVAGRELREGCIVPSIAGGLCQLSNALYDAALQANFEILERHAHSEIVPGSVAEQGKDATIFWNYVDLRFRSNQAFSIEAWMTDEKLVVRFRAEKPAQKPVEEPAKKMFAILPITDHASPNSCMSCGVTDCYRAPTVSILSPSTRTAYLVDEYWPEFDAYINKNKTENDSLLLPIDGKNSTRQITNGQWKVLRNTSNNGYLLRCVRLSLDR